MEQAMVSGLTSLGVAGMGYFFLWIFMRRTFEQVDAAIEKIGGLTKEMGELSKSMAQIHESQTVAHIVTEINRDISEIKSTGEKVLFGDLAISKGYMTQEQVAEVAFAQRRGD